MGKRMKNYFSQLQDVIDNPEKLHNKHAVVQKMMIELTPAEREEYNMISGARKHER